MQQYELVKEFGEGVDCMFREMAEAGNPAPEYKQVEFMVKVKLTSAMRDENVEKTDGIRIKETVNVTEKVNEKVNERQKLIISAVSENPHITQSELAQMLKIIVHVNKNLKKLQEQGIIRRVGPDKGGHWEVVEQG